MEKSIRFQGKITKEILVTETEYIVRLFHRRQVHHLTRKFQLPCGSVELRTTH